MDSEYKIKKHLEKWQNRELRVWSLFNSLPDALKESFYPD